jgi:hypothetical protein
MWLSERNDNHVSNGEVGSLFDRSSFPRMHGPNAEHTTISFAVAAWLSTNALPFGTERKGITVIGSSLRRDLATACRTPWCF